MKNLSTLLYVFTYCFISFSFAQKETRHDFSSYFDKGNKTAGIEICIAGDYNTILQLDFSKNSKNLGLLLLPSYGWFVQKNWMIGIQGLAGYAYNKYQNIYTTSPSISKYTDTDFGIAPLTRYFVPIGKRNIVSIFAQAALPLVYSSSKRETKQTGGTNPYNSSYKNTELTLRGNMGLGVSLNGHLGSIEINANTSGLFLGFHKYIGRNK